MSTVVMMISAMMNFPASLPPGRKGNSVREKSKCGEFEGAAREEEYKEYYYDYLDAEYIDGPWVDLDFKSSEDEVGDMVIAESDCFCFS